MSSKQRKKTIYLLTAICYELDELKATRATENLSLQCKEYLGALIKQLENEPIYCGTDNGNSNNETVKDLLVKYGITTKSKINTNKDKSIITQSYNFVEKRGYDDFKKILVNMSLQRNIKNKSAYLSQSLKNALNGTDQYEKKQ